MDANDLSDIEKKELFERFLTYRRRMSRMCSVQGVYLFDIRQRAELVSEKIVLKKDIQTEANFIYKNILYCYKNFFFSKQEYGDSKKNKKIDEKHFLNTITMVIKDLENIDKIIAKYLNEKWTVNRLDSIVRAILRCSVCEILEDKKTEIAVLTSEYTNIAGHFFNGKEIGFINGVVDKIGKTERKNET